VIMWSIAKKYVDRTLLLPGHALVHKGAGFSGGIHNRSRRYVYLLAAVGTGTRQDERRKNKNAGWWTASTDTRSDMVAVVWSSRSKYGA
jgi:hypothetical protein